MIKWKEYLKDFRKRNNLKQTELAEKLSIDGQPLSRRAVEQWEAKSMANSPPPYLLYALNWLEQERVANDNLNTEKE